MFKPVASGLGFIAHAALAPFEGQGVCAETGEGLRIFDIKPFGVGNDDFLGHVREAGPELGDALVEGTGDGIGFDQQLCFLLRGHGIRRDPDKIVRCRRKRFERLSRAGGAGSDEGGRFRRFLELSGIEIIRIGIACLFPMDDAKAGAHIHAPRGRRDLIFIEADRVLDRALEIDLGEVAAAAQGGFEQLLQLFFGKRGRDRSLVLTACEGFDLFCGKVLPQRHGNKDRSRLKASFEENPPLDGLALDEIVHETSSIKI